MDRLVGLMCYFFDMKIISLLEKKRIHPDFSDPEVNQDDIYKFDPPNLPGLSESDSDEQGWYFFCEPYYKYAKSERVNRQTPGGYWTITGGGSDLRNKRGQVIGSKKILVFYLGDSSNGVKTDWVMHEFYVKDKNDPRYKKDFVLCFIERKPKKSTNRKKKSNKSALSTPDDGQPRNSLSSVSVCQVAESPYIEVESQQPSSSHRLSYDSGGNITEISFSGVEPQPLQTANLVRDPGSLFRESINSLVESQPLLDNNFVPDQMNLFAEMQVDPQLLAELYSTNSSCWLNQSPLPAPQLPTNPDQYQGFNSSTYSTGFWEDCNMQDFQFDGDFGDAISLWDLEN
ncbi:NAC domain-containing protein 1-like isoform X2 [Mangifera indica]|uniref:NAC domain-containing protein 1-like isoform X2 n=1 Tax=Mangifera indica TaxID=29780 RepID=UPI001CF9C534|nr:NAC domain-containing protein 1-like isoform X2 [Mangifera indica]